jgi:hypothetical protein
MLRLCAAKGTGQRPMFGYPFEQRRILFHFLPEICDA